MRPPTMRAVHLAAAAEYLGEIDYHARCIAGAARDLVITLWFALRVGNARVPNRKAPAPRAVAR